MSIGPIHFDFLCQFEFGTKIIPWTNVLKTGQYFFANQILLMTKLIARTAYDD